MIIGTGNEDCVGLRHRESQTLFLSLPIKSSNKENPVYIKVYLMLYIMAFQDAVDRAQQLESGALSPRAQSLLRVRLDDKPDLPNALSSGLFDKYPVEVQLPSPSTVRYFLNLYEDIEI